MACIEFCASVHTTQRQVPTHILIVLNLSVSVSVTVNVETSLIARLKGSQTFVCYLNVIGQTLNVPLYKTLVFRRTSRAPPSPPSAAILLRTASAGVSVLDES